jgi:hypothetical protein
MQILLNYIIGIQAFLKSPEFVKGVSIFSLMGIGVFFALFLVIPLIFSFSNKSKD